MQPKLMTCVLLSVVVLGGHTEPKTGSTEQQLLTTDTTTTGTRTTDTTTTGTQTTDTTTTGTRTTDTTTTGTRTIDTTTTGTRTIDTTTTGTRTTDTTTTGTRTTDTTTTGTRTIDTTTTGTRTTDTTDTTADIATTATDATATDTTTTGTTTTEKTATNTATTETTDIATTATDATDTNTITPETTATDTTTTKTTDINTTTAETTTTGTKDIETTAANSTTTETTATDTATPETTDIVTTATDATTTETKDTETTAAGTTTTETTATDTKTTKTTDIDTRIIETTDTETTASETTITETTDTETTATETTITETTDTETTASETTITETTDTETTASETTMTETTDTETTASETTMTETTDTETTASETTMTETTDTETTASETTMTETTDTETTATDTTITETTDTETTASETTITETTDTETTATDTTTTETTTTESAACLPASTNTETTTLTTKTSAETSPVRSIAEEVKNKSEEFLKRLNGPPITSTEAEKMIKDISSLLSRTEELNTSESSPDPVDQNKLIQVLDRVLESMEMEEDNLTVKSDHVTLALKKVTGTHFQTTSLSVTDSDLQFDNDDGSATGSVTRGSIVLPASLLDNLSAEEKQRASRIQFCYYKKTGLFQSGAMNNSKLISGVLSASVGNLTISNLKENMIITLRNTEPVQNKSVSCKFWKHGANNSGSWSSDGCTVLRSTANETVCSCNHLTNFGVLLDLSNKAITNPRQVTILNNLTYVGCGISSIFLMVTLVVYLWMEKLRKVVPNKILIQLCTALLLLNLVFLLNSFLAKELDSVGLCIPTTFFLNYFLLASFTWMTLESVHIYMTIVKVFNSYVAHFMVKVTLVGWGVPLLPVIIPLAVDKTVYGIQNTTLDDGSKEYFCWWKNILTFRIVVGTYFCVTYLLNLSTFIVVMVLLCRIKKKKPHSVQNRTIVQDVWSVTALAVLLGLTWVFGLFSWGSVQLVFTYLFVVCNSLHGFFIFVFRCAAKDDIRKQYSKIGFFRRISDGAHRVWNRITSSLTHLDKSPSQSNPAYPGLYSERSVTEDLSSDTVMSN